MFSMSFQLARVDCSQLDPSSIGKFIKTEADVLTFKSTSGYKYYISFLDSLSEAVAGHPSIPPNEVMNISDPGTQIGRTLKLLETLENWIDDIPPLQSPQRYGNLAFRSWGKRLEVVRLYFQTRLADLDTTSVQQSTQLLETLLDPSLRYATLFLRPYLLTSFGDFTRMDYGTGHEASFGFFLLSLTLIGHFEQSKVSYRDIVQKVFYRYGPRTDLLCALLTMARDTCS